MVDQLADVVELPPPSLDAPVSALDPLDRARVHLARALANGPELVLLEDPTATSRGPTMRAAFGRSLASRRGLRAAWGGWRSVTTRFRSGGGRA